MMVPAQVILDPSGNRYTVMYDTGSQITMITKDCARKLGAKEIGESTLVILGIGNGRALPYKIYEITLTSISGEPATFRAHSVSELKIEVANYDAAVIKKSFPELTDDEPVQPIGFIQLLVGSDNAHLMPKEKSFKDKMIPTCAQHQNGQAERLIGIVKIVLDSVFMNQVCTFSELSTVLHETALIVNSRLLGVPGRAEDTEAGQPITPLHLMMGRATVDAPRVCSDRPVSPTHQMQFLRDLRNQFWNKF